jgi:elongation factor P
MLSISDIKKDSIIQINGVPYKVVEYLHSKMGRGGAVAKTKLKNLADGTVMSKTFQGNDKIERAEIEYKKLQYLYSASEKLYMMEMTTYEQTDMSIDLAGEASKFLVEGMEVSGMFFNNRVVALELPKIINVSIEHTEPGIKGDTVSASLKPASISSGAIVQVPLFIKQGDEIKVDTRTGEYVGRV